MAVLQLHNTLTRRKEPFEPLDASRVRLYVCGPTVYQRIHVGNARPLVVFDVLFRLLRHTYGPDSVVYVRNITDIDDKIIDQAARDGQPIEVLTARTTEAFLADAAALVCLEPTHQPRATQHIDDMLTLIGALVDKGHAYAAEGHVMFSVHVGRSLWPAVRTQPRRADRRCPRRRRALQARSGRFRALEAIHTRHAGLGQPLGPRAAGLAHRVLGHGRAFPGRAV